MGTLADAALERWHPTPARPVALVLTEDSKPALGGIAEMLHRLASALSDRYDVRVVSSVPGAATASTDAVTYEEVPWFRARMRLAGDDLPIVRRVNTLLWYLRRPARVRRLLDALLVRHRPEWLVLFRLSDVTLPWTDAARARRVPYDVVVYGLELVERMSPRERRRRAGALRAARRVFAISDATAALVRTLGIPDERITLVRPGIDPEALVPPPAGEGAAIRARIAAPARRYMLSVCTLVPRKGVDLAIRAFAALASAFPDVDYVIAGQGARREELERLAATLGVADRVRLVGPVDDATKLALYEGCELFVLPNRRFAHDMEGFGIVFLEAGLFGKAVIGGANGGALDAVADGTTGLLVDTSTDEVPLREAMRRLLSDPELARRLGENGRARALADFTWAGAATRFHEAHAADVAAGSAARR